MATALEHLVRERALGRCEYCHILEAFDRPAFEIEHIVPRQHRGATLSSNLAVACFTCNRHKGSNLSGIDPDTKRLTRLFNPRRHKWDFHFRWNNATLVGRTAIGRVTIHVLGINLPLRLRLRQELIDEMLFP